MIKKINRLWNYLYASAHGYFWLPCPICGENFGGHELKHGGSLMTSINTGRGVCSNCAEEAKRRNKKFMKENYNGDYAYGTSKQTKGGKHD